VKYLLSLAVGIGVGYFGAMLALEKRYILQAENDMADAAEYCLKNHILKDKAIPEGTVEEVIETDDTQYNVRISKMNFGKKQDDPELVAAAAEALEMYQGESPLSTDIPHEIVMPGNQKVAYNMMSMKTQPSRSGTGTRTIREPFIISDEDYLDGEPGIELQQVYEYYTDDDVLCTIDGNAIQPDTAVELVGNASQLPFGHLSGGGMDSENVIYIRCDRHKVDMEIHKVVGRYSDDHGTDNDE
jgi:hypothetical protein